MNFATGNLINAKFAKTFIICGVGWLPPFWISSWLKLSHKVTYSFSVDFVAALTLVPAFRSAILEFAICLGINLKWKLNKCNCKLLTRVNISLREKGTEKEAKYPKESIKGFHNNCSATKFKICCARRTGWLFIAVAHKSSLRQDCIVT